MSAYSGMYKKVHPSTGSTSSTFSGNSVGSVKPMKAPVPLLNSVRSAEPPTREPLRQTENVMRSHNVVRPENSLNKVCNGKITFIKLWEN